MHAVFEQREAARTEQRQVFESPRLRADRLCTEFERAVEGATSDTAVHRCSRTSTLAELGGAAGCGAAHRAALPRRERTYRLLRQAQHDAVMRGVDRLTTTSHRSSGLNGLIGSTAGSDARAHQRHRRTRRRRPGPFADRIKALTHGDARQ